MCRQGFWHSLCTICSQAAVQSLPSCPESWVSEVHSQPAVYSPIYTHVYAHVCTHVYAHACTHVYAHVHAHVYTYACTIRTAVHTCLHMPFHMHTHRPATAQYVIWPRIDQKSCLKAISCANLTPIVVENNLEGMQHTCSIHAASMQPCNVHATCSKHAT